MCRCVLAEIGHSLEVRDVPDRLEDMDGVFEKGEDVRRIEVDAVLFAEELGDLAVVESILPEFQDLPGELLLRAAAHGGVTAGATQEGVDEVEDLLVQSVVKTAIIEPGGDRLKGGAMECLIGEPITCQAFQFP